MPGSTDIFLKVRWPIPVDSVTTLRNAALEVKRLIKAQYQNDAVLIESIFVGNSELDGLYFTDDGSKILLRYVYDPDYTERDSMEIFFFVPALLTDNIDAIMDILRVLRKKPR